VDRLFAEKHIIPIVEKGSKIADEIEKAQRYSSTEVDIDTSALSVEQLTSIFEVTKKIDSKEGRSLQSQITAVRSIMRNPADAKIPSLKVLEAGLIAFLKENIIDGWLYYIDKDKIANPYLVTKIKYDEGSSRNEEKPFVTISLTANSARKAGTDGPFKTNIVIDGDDIRGKTISQILSNDGYYHETPELKKIYEQHLDLFTKFQPKFNAQFWIEGHIRTGWDNRRDATISGKAKAVNDEELVSRKFYGEGDSRYWRNNDVENGFDKIPFHSYVYVFHLGIHESVWVHVSNMIPYEYNVSLRDKLVLPQDHRDLIDILVEDMEILQDDIIEGKSGGTTILCVGGPGLGKTLTAEVYSEVVGKPLYRVHSGQLGISSHKVEEKLVEILKRAARFGAVLLIDEADVYIRERGDDIEHNAVVASFLRTLEYFDGLLFMTTNRSNDVDDAIRSRCIAVIKYVTPTPGDLKLIWKVLSTKLKVDLKDDVIDELVEKFPDSSGRDVKELLKLTSRYAKSKNLPLTFDIFRKLTQFRNMTAKE
jgi:hypothetical protein